MIVPGTELALKQYSVFQEATHSMSFSTLSFSPPYQAASVEFMPAMRCPPLALPCRAHPKPSSQ